MAVKTWKVASHVLTSLLARIVLLDVSSVDLSAIPAAHEAAKKSVKIPNRDQWAQNTLQELMSLANLVSS